MRSDNEQTNPLSSPLYRELQLLTEVDATPIVTQRQLSLKIGIALGLTNVMLRSLVQKGYLRVSHASWKQRLYNLTPEGVTHKLRLTAAYISRVLDHYQGIRQTLREQMETLAVNEESHVAIYGTSEFAELVFLGMKEIGIEEIGILGVGAASGVRFLGMPVQDPSTVNFDDYDKIVVAVLDGSQERNAELLSLGVPPHKVVAFFSSHNWEQKT